MNTKEKGNIGIGKAISYYTELGWIVSIPLNDSQDYDLIVHDIDNDVLYKVQVKYTASKANSGNYTVSMRSISGSTKQEYKTVKNTDIDLLFVYTESGDCLNIPIFDINVVSSLTITKDILNKYGSLTER